MGASEEKDLATDDDSEFGTDLGRIPLERLPIARLRKWEAIKISDRSSFQVTRRGYFKLFSNSWRENNQRRSRKLKALLMLRRGHVSPEGGFSNYAVVKI